MTTETQDLLIFKNTLDKIKYHFKKSGLSYDLAKSINREIPLTIFARAAREKISIDEWVRTIEDAPSQQTVVSTVRLSYEGVKSYFSYEANKFFTNYKEADIRVLSYGEVKEIEDLNTYSFDVVFEIDGEKIAIEIKVTQSKKKFMGTNHSTSKVEDYLFIALDVDRDTPVEVGKNYLRGILVETKKFALDAWKGERTNNSSRTTLGFDSNDNGLI